MVTALLRWWYGAGWARQAQLLAKRVDGVLEFFSIGLLAKTLFDPFRQIGAGSVRGSLQVQFQAWLDRTFSRFVGFFVRSTMIFVGLLCIVGVLVMGIVQLVCWPLVPFLPVIGIGLSAIRWLI